jgi:hypothetical protein
MIRQAKIDVSKINKNNIKERKFKNKDGELITVKELELEIKDVKEEKVLHTTAQGKQLVKVGFISEKSYQNGEGKWENGTILGDVTEWRDKELTQEDKEYIAKAREAFDNKNTEDGIDVSQIPF